MSCLQLPTHVQMALPMTTKLLPEFAPRGHQHHQLLSEGPIWEVLGRQALGAAVSVSESSVSILPSCSESICSLSLLANQGPSLLLWSALERSGDYLAQMDIKSPQNKARLVVGSDIHWVLSLLCPWAWGLSLLSLPGLQGLWTERRPLLVSSTYLTGSGGRQDIALQHSSLGLEHSRLWC
jgi:hypothetical protein